MPVEKERAEIAVEPNLVAAIRGKQHEYGTESLNETIKEILERAETMEKLTELMGEELD